MENLRKKIEGLAYGAETDLIFWYEILRDYFEPKNIDDLTDFDNEASLEETYLVSLNPKNEKLLSEEIDGLLEEGDAYFACINISRIKPLALLQYWKYPKEGGGQELVVANEPFLPEQEELGTRLLDFAKDHGLLLLTEVEYEEVRTDYFMKRNARDGYSFDLKL